MKLLCCYECKDVIGLARTWRNCECGESGGGYLRDGDEVLLGGPCFLLGMKNSIIQRKVRRGEVWIYDMTNGKVERMIENPGDWPDRLRRAS